MIQTILKINGMMCGMCEAHINECIRNRFQVKKVSSSYKKGESVILSTEEIDEQAIAEEIRKTGYTLVSIRTMPYTKKKLFG